MQNLAGGGAEKMALALVAALHTEEHSVTLLLHENIGDLPHNVPNGITVKTAFSSRYKRWRIPLLFLITLRHCWSNHVIVAGSEGRVATLCILSAAILRKQSIGWIHNDWHQFGKVTSWRTKLSLHIYRYANCVVAVSQGAADSIGEIVPAIRNRTKIIYNGVDIQEVQSLAKADLDSDISAKTFNPYRIVCVGRLNYQKGYDILINALEILHSRRSDFSALFVGQGDLRDELMRLCEEKGISELVHFLGWRRNPYSIMSRSDLFVLPSRFEGFGLVLVEALACGTPIVSFDCPSGPREILANGSYGKLVEPQNVEALATAVDDLLNDEAERKLFQNEAERGTSKFSSHHFAESWRQLVNSLSSP